MVQDLRGHWLNWDEDPWPAAVFWYSPGVRPRSVSLFHCQASMGAGCRSIWHCGIILGYLMSWCPRSFWGVPVFLRRQESRNHEPSTSWVLGQGEHLKPIDGKSLWLSGGFFEKPIQTGKRKHHQDHQVARGYFQTPKALRIWRLFFNPLGMSWASGQGTKLSEKIQHAALAVLGSDRCNAQGAIPRGCHERIEPSKVGNLTILTIINVDLTDLTIKFVDLTQLSNMRPAA